MIFVADEDIGTYTIKAVDDPRTLNKILHMRPKEDIYSHNELVSLWEKKSGKQLKRIYILKEEVLNQIKGERKCLFGRAYYDQFPFPVTYLSGF